MKTFKTAALVSALLMSSTAYAGSPAWKISEMSGTVSIAHVGANKIAFNRIALKGGAVGEGDIISTANGRAVLVRGEEYVVVSPNSRLRIVDTAEENTVTQFFQSVGNSVFKIKKKSTPHFGVQTPFLAAVVKGTTFSVTVTETGAAVQVTEGRVEVSTLDGAASHMVIPGEIGLVSQTMPYRLTVEGNTPLVIDSPNAVTPTASADQKPVGVAEAAPAAEDKPAAETSRFEGKIAAPVSEAPVQLASVTGGLVEGNSTLVSTVTSTALRAELDHRSTMAAPPTVEESDETEAEDSDESEAPAAKAPVQPVETVVPKPAASTTADAGGVQVVAANGAPSPNAVPPEPVVVAAAPVVEPVVVATAPVVEPVVVAAAPVAGPTVIAAAPVVTQVAAVTPTAPTANASGFWAAVTAAATQARQNYLANIANSGTSGTSGNSGPSGGSGSNGNSGSNSGSGSSGNSGSNSGSGSNGTSGSNSGSGSSDNSGSNSGSGSNGNAGSNSGSGSSGNSGSNNGSGSSGNSGSNSGSGNGRGKI